ncbi:MAG: tetratricopeptide repeat protein [Paracoccaceae bacterium]
MSPQRNPDWRFLGDVAINCRDGDVTPKLGKKAIGVLACLSLSPEGMGRDELAAMVWPDPDPSRSRHNLRQCLLSLRRAFGEDFDRVFEVSTDRLALRQDAVETDVSILLEIDSGGPVTAGDALVVCTGPFVRGLTTRAKPFDEWVSAQRGRLLAVEKRVLERALAAAETDGRGSDAARLVRALEQLSASAPAPERAGGAVISRFGRRAVLALVLFAVLVISAGLFVGARYFSADFRDWTNETLLGVPASPPRIAVLPFTSVNGTPEEAGLAGGVTLGVNFALYAITAKDLYVVTSLSPARTLSREELKRVARKLKVRYLITGAVALDGDAVRIDAQRLDTETGSGDIVRREEFRLPTTRAFQLQDEITLWILKGLQIDVSPAEWDRIRFLNDTSNLEAWLAATRALGHLIRVTRKDVAFARRDYRKALDLDNGYIAARRGLAWTYFLNVRMGWAESPGAAMDNASKHLKIVLARTSEHGTAQSLLGAILLLQGEYGEAVAAGERARELLPGSADVSAILAHTLTYVGRHDEALELIDKAMDLSPLHPGFYRWTKGRALRLAGRIPDSVAELEKDYHKGEPSIVHLVELASSYSAAGRIADARRVAAEIRRLKPGFHAAVWLMHPPISIPEMQAQELKYLSDAGL